MSTGKILLIKSRWRRSRRRKHLFTATTMPDLSRRDGVGSNISCRIFLGERSLPPVPSSVGSRYLSIRKAATLARTRNSNRCSKIKCCERPQKNGFCQLSSHKTSNSSRQHLYPRHTCFFFSAAVVMPIRHGAACNF